MSVTNEKILFFFLNRLKHVFLFMKFSKLIFVVTNLVGCLSDYIKIPLKEDNDKIIIHSLFKSFLICPFVLNSHKTLMSWLILFVFYSLLYNSPSSRTQYGGEWGKVEQREEVVLEEDKNRRRRNLSLSELL